MLSSGRSLRLLVLLEAIVTIRLSEGESFDATPADNGSRLVVTLACGLNSINLPIYLSGVASPSLRGAMINLYTTFVGECSEIKLPQPSLSPVSSCRRGSI